MFQRTIWFLSTQATAKHRVFPSGAVSSSPAPPPHLAPHSSTPPSSSFTPFQQWPHFPAVMLEALGTTCRRTEDAAEERGCCDMPPPVCLHPCTHTHTDRTPQNQCLGYHVKKKGTFLTSPRATAAPITSHSHTRAQGAFNWDYINSINSIPTLQKEFKDEPNNRRTISSVITCPQTGLSRHTGCWRPIPPN